jgi:hypothetical protein
MHTMTLHATPPHFTVKHHNRTLLTGLMTLDILISPLRAMGEACLSKHVEEQGAALALLITRINLNPDYSDSDTGEK